MASPVNGIWQLSWSRAIHWAGKKEKHWGFLAFNVSNLLWDGYLLEKHSAFIGMRIRCTELKIPSLSTPMARMFKFYFSQPGMEHVCVSVCVRMCALACLCAHLCICSLFPTIQWWSESILFLSSVTPTTVTLEACKSVYFLVQSGIDITLPFSFRVEMNVNWYKKKKKSLPFGF